MSVKLDIYNDIISTLKTKVPEIKTLGLWNNQFANEDEEFVFNFPAVFIEFTNLLWTTTNLKPSRLGTQGNISKEQKGEGSIITLHIGFSELSDAKTNFADLDPLIEKVFFAIQGLSGNYYTPLLRNAERQDSDHDRVIDWQKDFSTMLTQCGEQDADLTKIAKDTLSLEITKDLDIDVPTQTGIRTGDRE